MLVGIMGRMAPARVGSSRPGPGLAGVWGMAWGVLVGFVLGSACVLPLDDDIACGDGYVDLDAGEQCDPAVSSSYIHACAGTSRPDGDAACDPSTCTIINTKAQCAVCGDGFVDDGEQCDGDNLNGDLCPGGVGALRCNDECQLDYTYCKRCGNSVLDPGEECDPNTDPTDLVLSKPLCSELESPYVGKPYTSGQPSTCRDDCRWDRAGCGYCGNGRIEDEGFVVDFEGTPAIPELCDGDLFDPVAREELTSASCPSNADLRPLVTACATDCQDFVFEPQACCIKKGGLCPEDDDPVRCCYELENPGVPGGPCQTEFGEVVAEVCL